MSNILRQYKSRSNGPSKEKEDGEEGEEDRPRKKNKHKKKQITQVLYEITFCIYEMESVPMCVSVSLSAVMRVCLKIDLSVCPRCLLVCLFFCMSVNQSGSLSLSLVNKAIITVYM